MEEGWNVGVTEGDGQGGIAVSQQASPASRVARSTSKEDGVDSERVEGTQKGASYPVANVPQGIESTIHRGGDTHSEEPIHVEAIEKDGQSQLAASQDGEHIEKLAKKGIRKVDRINTDNLMRLFYRQDGRCALSGRELTPENVQLDHIDPFAGSDDHTIGNVHLVTAEINIAKGCMTVDEFVAMCCDVADLSRGVVAKRPVSR